MQIVLCRCLGQLLSYHGNYSGPGSGTYDAFDHYHAYVGDAQQRAIQHIPSHILLKGKLFNAMILTRIWYDDSRQRFFCRNRPSTCGLWYVSSSLSRSLSSSASSSTFAIASQTMLLKRYIFVRTLYKRKFTNKSFRTSSRPLSRLGGKYCPPRESEESSAYFGPFCRSLTRCFARPSRLPSWRLGTAKRTGPPCRGTRSRRWWRRSVR